MAYNKYYWGIIKLQAACAQLPPHNKIFLLAKKTYGTENQLLSCVEELGELSTELLKFRKGGSSIESVAGEVADVIIQLAVLFENNDIVELVKQQIPIKLLKCKTKIEDRNKNIKS